jgi:chromosome partitioning protein
MSRIITITNPKGGVGKTTTTINLGASLAIYARKVLLVDIDPDGAVSTGLGLTRDKIKCGVLDIFSGTADLKSAIHSTGLNGLDIVPCNVWTSDHETMLADLAKNRNLLKKELLGLTELNEPYDFIIIDSPPALSDLTIGALLASHSVIIPLQCGHFALKAVGRLMRIIRQLRQTVNPDLRIEGILLNFFEKGTRVSERVQQEARIAFGSLLFKTIIPKNSALGYAAFLEKPAALVNITDQGARAYLNLALEVLGRNGES